MDTQRLHRLLDDCYTRPAWKPQGCSIVDTPELFQVVTPPIPFRWANKILRFTADAADASERIERALDPYRTHRVPMLWIVTPSSRPIDLGERLEDAGLRFFTDIDAMFAETSQLALTAPDDVTIDDLTPNEIEAYAAAASAAWSHTEAEHASLVDDLRRGVGTKGPLRYYLARYRGEPAGTAMLYTFDDAGYMMGGSVHPALRGKGVYRALLAHRVEVLRREGVPLALVHAGATTSAPICKKLGFSRAFVSKSYVGGADWGAEGG